MGRKEKYMTNPCEEPQTAFVCTEMVLWDFLQKKEGEKSLSSKDQVAFSLISDL